MNRTKIEYLDYTLNLITGCSGDGCAVRPNCWALAMAKRLAGRYGYPKDEPFKPTFHKDKLLEPLKIKKPSRIGLNFMGETFDKLVHPDWLEDILELVEKCPQHTFIILTKQPQNIPNWFFGIASPNLWLGVSVNRKADLWRLESLKKNWFGKRIVSFEPLYECLGDVDLDGLQWIIIGAQTRPNLQPDSYWVWSLKNEAERHGIPVFMKNNLTAWKERLQQYP